ncbi:EAL domain-containing protein [Pseudokineococcus sp. 5B2Z-1]|uniref:EAL domain-containing protein n=1 Tax=Pseudokineococcus sp. 5B2Z-1 TaxID=3132744 RepID=UPI0030B2CD40
MSTVPETAGGPAPGADPRSAARRALAAVLAEPGLLGCAVQPVVGLESATVAGYEVLARPAAHLGVGPAPLFAAAGDAGALAQLHVLALRLARPLLASLPPDTFLTVNVDPLALAEPAVVDELLSWGDLGGLVVEVLEGRWPDDHARVLAPLDALRTAGALVALDDVGAAWAGLARVLEVRPSFVKLDGRLVAQLGRDPAVEAAVRAVGDMAATLDAWVCLEGVERREQLATAVRLGVPLAQGYLLGRPERAWPAGDLDDARDLAAAARRGDGLADLVRSPSAEELRTDARGRPLAVRTALPGGGRHEHPVTSLSPATAPHEALARAMARPEHERFAPLVVTSADGRALGLVHVDVLATAVATAAHRAAAG